MWKFIDVISDFLDMAIPCLMTAIAGAFMAILVWLFCIFVFSM